MTNITQWSTPESIQTGLAAELNSLATNTLSALGTAIPNNADKDTLVDIELLVTYGTNPVAGGYVALFIAPALDGSNYADAQREFVPHLLCTFPMRAVTTAQRITARGIMLPPFSFKFYLDNQSGQTMAASGNTVRFSRYNPEIQ